MTFCRRRALDAAVAREIGRELEAFNNSRNHSDSLPRFVHSTQTDENSLLRVGADSQGPVQRESSPLLPPAPAFSRRSVSPRPSFDWFPASTSSPSLGQSNYQEPLMNLSRTFLPMTNPSPELPSVSTRFDNPYSLSSPATYTKQSSIPIPGGGSGGSLPPLSKSATSSPLPPDDRTIPAAAFRQAILRKESTLQMSGSSLGANGGPDSRPLPTVPLDDRVDNGDVWDDGSRRSQDNYNSGRFVTDSENEWK